MAENNHRRMIERFRYPELANENSERMAAFLEAHNINNTPKAWEIVEQSTCAPLRFLPPAIVETIYRCRVVLRKSGGLLIMLHATEDLAAEDQHYLHDYSTMLESYGWKNVDITITTDKAPPMR